MSLLTAESGPIVLIRFDVALYLYPDEKDLL